MKRSLLVLSTVALAFAGSASPAFAQASVLGSSFPIYAAAARGSAVAYDSRNNVYLVVSGYGLINGRFVSPDGVPLAACTAGASSFVLGGSQFGHFPRVAYSPDANGGLGGFVVTWHEADSIAGGNAVHARPVSLSGCIGGERIISNTSDGNGTAVAGDQSYWESGASIAYSTVSKRFLVAWRSLVSPDGSPNDINARLLDTAGNPLGSAPMKITQTGIYEDNPSVAYSPASDQFIVAFAGYDSSAFVGSRLVSASSGAIGPQFELTRSGGTYITDSTYIASSGRFLVAWYQLPGGTTGRLVNGSSGAPEGDIIPMSTRFGANDALSVAYNNVSDTSFLVSHDQASPEDGGLEISAAGVPGGGFGATNIGGKGNFYPRIAASTADKRWMLSTANVFQTIYGQFIVTGSSGGGAGGGGVVAAPTPTLTPLSATLAQSVATPIVEGTAITWTAAASGGTAPYQYQFWRYTEGTGWSVAQTYSANASYTWFPPAGLNAVQVWVRSAGSTANYEVIRETGGFTVVAPAPKLTGLTPNVAMPVTWNTPVTFTASATGGPNPLQFKFLIYSASTGAWSVGQDYSSSNRFTWYPPRGMNAVQVWVRGNGMTAMYQDWKSTDYFAVAATPARLVGFTSNAAGFPVLPTSTITWTATATGSGPIEYRFIRYDRGANSWSVLRDWSTNNQASWTPGQVNSGWHVIQVWARTVGSTNAYEDWKTTDYFLITTSASVALTPSRSLNGLRVGEYVTWTANAVGAGDWEYKFLSYDSSRGWVVQQEYGPQRSFTWYPPPGTDAVQVWIRAVGSHADWERYAESGAFVVNP